VAATSTRAGATRAGVCAGVRWRVLPSAEGSGDNGGMKRRFDSFLVLGIALVAASAVLYAALYLTMGRLGDIEFYTFLDIAFIPVQVLIVGLVLNRLLAMREKREMFEKLNMVIGAFFSEVGTGLLDLLSEFDEDIEVACDCLHVSPSWTAKEYANARRSVERLKQRMDARKAPMEPLRDFLLDRRRFMLGLLENPNLLEHQHFTDLLWASFHLTEELVMRQRLQGLPEEDYAHLSGDMRRAYVILLEEWLAYVQHLQRTYPYMFSLAVRSNPFDRNAKVEIS
jgi:hypothetical protein